MDFSPVEQHDDAVQAQRDAAMGRRAIRQRVEEESEAVAQLFFAKAERFEQSFLNILAVNSNAARAQFDAVQHQVVAFRAHFPRSGLEFFQVFVDDSGEGMLRADPGLVGLAPFKQAESR